MDRQRVSQGEQASGSAPAIWPPVRKLSSPRWSLCQLLSGIRAWQIFVLALAVRLPLIWLRSPTALTENLRAGLTLAQRGYLGDPFIIPTGPTAHVAPAYPVIVAVVRTLTPSNHVCLRALSIIVALVTACNIAALLPISRALKLPRGSGTVAALLWLTPLFSWIELSAEQETPFTVAALLALVTLVFRTMGNARPGVMTGAKLGLAAGVAAYVTPTVLPVTALATLVGARLARWRMTGLIAVLAGAALAFALAILPYTLRNHQDLGAWFFMRDNLGIELQMSNGPDARATRYENEQRIWELHPSASPQAATLVRDLGEVGYNRLMQSITISWMKAHPRAALELTAERLGYMVLPRSPVWYQTVMADATSLMAIAGCVLLWRSRYKFGIRCLSAAIVGYLLVYLLVEHDIRYMYPALFLESLIAGSFVVMLVRIWRERHSGNSG